MCLERNPWMECTQRRSKNCFFDFVEFYWKFTFRYAAVAITECVRQELLFLNETVKITVSKYLFIKFQWLTEINNTSTTGGFTWSRWIRHHSGKRQQRSYLNYASACSEGRCCSGHLRHLRQRKCSSKDGNEEHKHWMCEVIFYRFQLFLDPRNRH